MDVGWGGGLSKLVVIKGAVGMNRGEWGLEEIKGAKWIHRY